MEGGESSNGPRDQGRRILVAAQPRPRLSIRGISPPRYRLVSTFEMPKLSFY